MMGLLEVEDLGGKALYTLRSSKNRSFRSLK